MQLPQIPFLKGAGSHSQMLMTAQLKDLKTLHLDVTTVQFHPEAHGGPRDTEVPFFRFDVPEDRLMPKLPHIKKVLLIGSGPIQIGQAAEFDFSGSQACRALREEGVKVVLVNSNPATIQTDPDMADEIYIEPLRVRYYCKNYRKRAT